MEGNERACPVCQVVWQIFWYGHYRMMFQIIGNAFSGQAHADIGNSPVRDLGAITFVEIQGDAIPDAERPFIREYRHRRVHAAQGTKEKVD